MADQLSRADMICFAEAPVSGMERCLLYDSELLSQEKDVPSEALDLGYHTCLISGQLLEVIENARLQVRNPDPLVLYRALRFFVANDAFADLSAETTRMTASTKGRRAEAGTAIEAALVAVEREMQSSDTDSIRQRQLELCRITLAAMLAHLNGSGVPVDSSLGQMTADQWDPKDQLTESVIRAEHLYVDVRGQS